VYCPKCGKETADVSQFCPKCGNTLIVTPATAAKSSRTTHYGRTAILAAILILLFLWATGYFRRLATSPRPLIIQKALASPHTLVLQNTAMTVKAGGYEYQRFTVTPGSTNVFVDGHFSATGGLGNDIEVFVLSEDGFANFKNGHQAQTYFNSGKVTQNGIDAVLPGGGTYYLVFNNGYSLLTPKAVQANVVLHYTN
jgi:zinc-ribbon domain